MRKLIKKHKRKIICTSPILFFLFISYTSFITPVGELVTDITLNASTTEGYVGDTFSVDVDVNTEIPINVIEAALSFPGEQMEVSTINQADSLISLWVNTPTFLNDIGTITFSGGILQQGGFVKRGKVMTIIFIAKKEGEATMQISRASFALADGLGTLVTPKTNILTFNIEEKPVQSPDLNESGTVNIVDAGLWVANLFTPEKSRDDINGDGKVNLKDLYFFW